MFKDNMNDRTKIIMNIWDDKAFKFLKTQTLGEILKPVKNVNECLAVYGNGVHIFASVNKTNYKITAYTREK